MAITVTATASGTGSANGLALSVKVLTGAAATQNGATAASATVTAPELAITPNATGSWVYGAVSSGVSSSAFSGTTAATQTFEVNFSDTTNAAAYGIFRSLNTTTGGTSTGFLGATSPSGSSGLISIALAEILASGTLAEDASSPAVPTPTKTAKTLTTASFTPAANSILVAMVSADYTGSGAVAMAVSDSGSLYNWTQLAGETVNLASIWLGTLKSTSVTGVTATATATAAAGSVSAGATIAGVTATATASATPGTAAAVVNVTGVVATAAAAAPAGSPAAGTTVAGPAATAAAAATAGTPSVPGAVTGVVATAAAAAPAGAAGVPATIAGVTATAAATAPAGTAHAGAAIAGPAATATAAAAPGVVTGSNPTVINTWTASRQINGPGFGYGAPAAGSIDCAVASTAGNWLIAYCSWTMTTGFLGCTMAVADDVHGYWVPLGIPSGDSAATGFTRSSIWARPGGSSQNPVPGADHVYMAPVGSPGTVYPTALGITVIEVTGLSPYVGTPGVVTHSTNGATSITANVAAPGAEAFMVAVAASDAATFSSGPGSGWTAVTGVNLTGTAPGILHTAPAYRLASAAETASWSTGTTGDLSAVSAAIHVANNGPSQPNQNWPAVQLQAGFGSGALTPPSTITWTDISDRFLAGEETSIQRGKQYELDQLEAAEISLTLDNNDGALTPSNASSPFWPDVLCDTPVRLLMTWEGRTYSVFSGFVERWPQTWDETWYGLAEITVTDAWSLQTAQLNAVQQEEILLFNPYAYWTLGDAAGSTFGQNFAPGNTNALEFVESKFGAGPATADFGADSGINSGDPSGTVWQQAGLSSLNNTFGYCLMCADPNYPSLTDGVTIIMWFSAAPLFTSGYGISTTLSAAASSGATSISVGDSIPAGSVIQLDGGTASSETVVTGTVTGTGPYTVAITTGGGLLFAHASGAAVVQASQVNSDLILVRGSNASLGFTFQLTLVTPASLSTSGQMIFTVADKVTRAATTTTVNSQSWFSGGLSHVALLLTQTTWQVIVDGGAFTGNSGTCNLPSNFSWLSFMGSADRYSTGGMLNGDACHVAVFPGLLNYDQVSQIVIAGYPLTLGGEFATEAPDRRIERLMQYGGWTGPRAISTQSTTQMAGITDIQGTEGGISADGVVEAQQGQPSGQAITNIVTSDNGFMSVDGNGVICYLSRGDLYNRTPQWFLGENTSGGEIPYETDIAFGYDKSLLYNDAELTQSTGTGTAVVAFNEDSAAQHGTFTFSATVYQYNISQVADEANWIVNTRGTVTNRAESVRVTAMANLANWPFVLGVESAQIAQVTRRPLPASADTVVQAIVTQVARRFDFEAGTAEVTIQTDSFPEAGVLTADDPVYGQLNGGNILGW
jgi:hypothetical protein